MTELLDEYEFALCLTHDVDRPFKTFQAPYYALQERDPSHLRSLLSDERPYWQFEEVMSLEDDLGVRSSFYFLNEKRLWEKGLREWLRPKSWKLYGGRYRIEDERIANVIRDLDRGGWEVGIHGSYETYDDRERLRWEKETLERVLGKEILGGRQHYLRLKRPTTWEHYRAIGLKYDTTLGSNGGYGFDGRYDVLRPFNDEFVVFPLTAMERPLLESAGSTEAALRECNRLLDEAAANDAVMTVLWHPRYFNESEFPGYRELYVELIEGAQDRGGWVGPCGECYDRLELEEMIQ